MVLERHVTSQSPQEAPRPQLNGLDQALNQGYRLHGYSSGGRLRVIRIELGDRLAGYGEHFSADEALRHADEDFLAGGRDYHEVYGKLYPHYLTGSSEVTSPLDGWLLQGHTVDAYQVETGVVRVELKGLKHVEQPQTVLDRAKTLRKPIVWMDRGYTYETRYKPHLFANGEHSARVTGIPKGKDEDSAWMYYRVKTGEGRDFNEALDKAFEAPDIEIEDPHK